MHPVEERNEGYFILIQIIAVILMIFFIFYNIMYLLVIMVHAFFIKQEKTIKKPLLLTSVYLIISSFTILFINIVLNCTIFGSLNEHLAFLLACPVSFLLLGIPYLFIYEYYKKTFKTAADEIKHYELISSYPKLMCNEHLARVKRISILGYYKIECKYGKECFKKKDIITVDNIIGYVGKVSIRNKSYRDYYIWMWTEKEKKIIDGDYDIIEIHYDKNIKSYDYIVANIIQHFNNDLNLHKPLNEILVRLVNNPPISENSKRLLKKYFKEIEYASN